MRKGTTRWVFMVAVAVMLISGCSVAPVTEPEGAVATLRAIDMDDRELKGKDVRMTERRTDGAWSVTFLDGDRFGRWDSRVVVTDWANEQHYDVPSLQGISPENGAWDNNGDFVFGYWGGATLTLAFTGHVGDKPSIVLFDTLRDTGPFNVGQPLNLAGIR